MTTADRKTDMLQRVRTSRDTFAEALAAVPPERMTEPGVNGDWTVKDVLAHITWWEQHLLQRLRTGQEPLYAPGDDPRQVTDAANAAIYTEHREQPLEDVRAAFDTSYQELLSTLQALPPEDLADDEFYDTIGSDTFSHYQQHTEMLRAWLAGSQTPPDQPSNG
jgi:uncharacterized protein (TIGR03083 family)